MAWVNRTSREQPPSGVGEAATLGIGPGSYETTKKGKLKPSFAAFGSSEGKDGRFQHEVITPGPGAYSSDKITYSPIPVDSKSSSFKSTSDRSMTSVTNAAIATPGPGAYASAATSFVPKKKIAKYV